MIPQTISTDEVRAFKKDLEQRGFDFDKNFNNDEILAQVLSAWFEWNKTHCYHPKSSIITSKGGTSHCKDCEKEAYGFERLEQLKKEN